MPSTNIQERLEEYRRRKEKEREAEIWASKPLWERILPERLSAAIKSIRRAPSSQEQPSNEPPTAETSGSDTTVSESESIRTEQPSTKKLRQRLTQPKRPILTTQQVAENEPEDSNSWDKFSVLLLLLKIALWFVLFLLCVQLEWGAVYVVFSGFFLILSNLRQGRRKPWEPSAYSVFNPGCEAIDGTIKPEQFEREIRGGFL